MKLRETGRWPTSTILIVGFDLRRRLAAVYIYRSALFAVLTVVLAQTGGSDVQSPRPPTRIVPVAADEFDDSSDGSHLGFPVFKLHFGTSVAKK